MCSNCVLCASVEGSLDTVFSSILITVKRDLVFALTCSQGRKEASPNAVAYVGKRGSS